MVYLFQVFKAIHREKIGHIAPLQNYLFIDVLSLFDRENIQGGVLENGIWRELFSY